MATTMLRALGRAASSSLSVVAAPAAAAANGSKMALAASAMKAPVRFNPFLGLGGVRGYAAVIDGLKYAESHEWVKLDGDVATIGISDHAQELLGDVVFAELPEVGRELDQGETFGVVESVKAASDVYAPVAGTVLEINEDLPDNSQKLNEEPYEGGWMIKLKVKDVSEVEALMDAAAYEKSYAE